MILKDFINYGCFCDFRNANMSDSFHYYIKDKKDCLFTEFGNLQFKLVINNNHYLPRFVIVDNRFVIIRCTIGSIIEKQLQINDFKIINDDQLNIHVSLNHIVTNSAKSFAQIVYNNGKLDWTPYQKRFDKIANINPVG